MQVFKLNLDLLFDKRAEFETTAFYDQVLKRCVQVCVCVCVCVWMPRGKPGEVWLWKASQKGWVIQDKIILQYF